MAGDASKAVSPSVLWGGGRSPFNMSYGKQMMWFFLVSDALTFGALLVALGYMRFANPDWPTSEQVFCHFPFTHTSKPLWYVAFMTFVLIVSSYTMVRAVEAGHRLNRKEVTKWMIWTIAGGFVFLGSQVWEWSSFIAGPDGIIGTGDDSTPWHNFLMPTLDSAGKLITDPETGFVKLGVEGAPAYSAFFFGVTGFHGFHVFSGVIINIIILINVIKGTYDKRGHYEMVEKTGLYWHFVDLVWVFVFTFFYLI